MQYYHHKPPSTMEIQMAMLMSMVSKGLGNKKAKPEDYILSKIPSTKQTATEMDAKDVQSFFSALAHQT